ncbi:MAG TPA: SAM-dependent methyltransferase [Bacteroidales bacterium]|nr:SAM-dependent methyltransferase [Bacteroidales bacterium]
MILSYLKYWLKASYKGGHGVHSPFMYHFVTLILEEKYDYFAFRKIDLVRKKLLLNKTEIEITDFGAGSRIFKGNKRKISDLAKYSAISKKHGELLFRMVNYYKPKTVLELGTSLGLGTMYLASPNSKTKLITIEGCKEIGKLAQHNFNQHNFTTIELVIEPFESALTKVLAANNLIDFVFIDGNHSGVATLNYFKMLLPILSENAIIVFDDINWSNSMQQAWKTICHLEKVRVSVDIFRFGIVFFNKNLSKQHYIIRF